jgi:hypothetical protein
MLKKTLQAYKNIAVLAAGFLFLFLVFNKLFLLYISLSALALASIHEKVAIFISTWWMKLGEAMGKVTGTVIMSLIFFVFLTPLALIKKLLSKKQVQRNTNWIGVYKTFSPKSFEKAW